MCLTLYTNKQTNKTSLNTKKCYSHLESTLPKLYLFIFKYYLIGKFFQMTDLEALIWAHQQYFCFFSWASKQIAFLSLELRAWLFEV